MWGVCVNSSDSQLITTIESSGNLSFLRFSYLQPFAKWGGDLKKWMKTSITPALLRIAVKVGFEPRGGKADFGICCLSIQKSLLSFHE